MGGWTYELLHADLLPRGGRDVERRVPALVLRGGIAPHGDEELDALPRVAPGRGVQNGVSALVRLAQGGLVVIHEDLQGGELAVSGGPVVGVVAVRVLLVRVGALLEENAGALDVAPQAAVVERRPAILVVGVHVRAELDERVQRLELALLGGLVKQRLLHLRRKRDGGGLVVKVAKVGFRIRALIRARARLSKPGRSLRHSSLPSQLWRSASQAWP